MTVDLNCKLLGRLCGGKWDKSYDISRRVYSVEGLAPTIHTCGGGNRQPKILEPRYGNYKNGHTAEAINKRGINTAILPLTKDERIRKLTERECLRLMGVKDEDIKKLSKNQSKSSLYHLAGDSIVTNVLSAIFAEMLKLKKE